MVMVVEMVPFLPIAYSSEVFKLLVELRFGMHIQNCSLPLPPDVVVL